MVQNTTFVIRLDNIVYFNSHKVIVYLHHLSFPQRFYSLSFQFRVQIYSVKNTIIAVSLEKWPILLANTMLRSRREIFLPAGCSLRSAIIMAINSTYKYCTTGFKHKLS